MYLLLVEMPPVKAFLTGAALLSSDASLGPAATTSGVSGATGKASLGGSLTGMGSGKAAGGSSVKGKNAIPNLRRAVSVVKPSSLPKPLVQKPRAASVSASAPTSPMNSYFAPHSTASTLSLTMSLPGSAASSSKHNRGLGAGVGAGAGGGLGGGVGVAGGAGGDLAGGTVSGGVGVSVGAAAAILNAAAGNQSTSASSSGDSLKSSSLDTQHSESSRHTHTVPHSAHGQQTSETAQTAHTGRSVADSSAIERYREDMIPLSPRSAIYPIFHTDRDRVRGQNSRPVSRLGSVPEEPLSSGVNGGVDCGVDFGVNSGVSGASPFLLPENQLVPLSSCHSPSDGGDGDGEKGEGGSDSSFLLDSRNPRNSSVSFDRGSLDNHDCIELEGEEGKNQRHATKGLTGQEGQESQLSDTRPQSLPAFPSISSFQQASTSMKTPDTPAMDGADDPYRPRSRTQSLRLSGTQSFLDQKLLKRISESDITSEQRSEKDGKVVKDGVGQGGRDGTYGSSVKVLSGKDKDGRDRAKGRDVNDILKERLAGVRGAR